MVNGQLKETTRARTAWHHQNPAILRQQALGNTANAHTHKNYLILSLRKMTDAGKKEMNKSLREIHRNTINQVKKMSKTIQELKTVTETIKKTQTEGILEMEQKL